MAGGEDESAAGADLVDQVVDFPLDFLGRGSLQPTLHVDRPVQRDAAGELGLQFVRIHAVGLGLWCAIVVGTIDNLLRPLLIGKDTEMPDLLVMLSTLGGLALFGAAGILVGPIIGALYITVWKLWGSAMDMPDGAVDAKPLNRDPVDASLNTGG